MAWNPWDSLVGYSRGIPDGSNNNILSEVLKDLEVMLCRGTPRTASGAMTRKWQIEVYLNSIHH